MGITDVKLYENIDGELELTDAGNLLMEQIDFLVEGRVKQHLERFVSCLSEYLEGEVAEEHNSFAVDALNIISLLAGSGDAATRKKFISKVAEYCRDHALSSAVGEWQKNAIDPGDAERNKHSVDGSGQSVPVGRRNEELDVLNNRLALVNESLDGAGQVASYSAYLSKTARR